MAAKEDGGVKDVLQTCNFLFRSTAAWFIALRWNFQVDILHHRYNVYIQYGSEQGNKQSCLFVVVERQKEDAEQKEAPGETRNEVTSIYLSYNRIGIIHNLQTYRAAS